MNSIYLSHLDYALGGTMQSVETAERAGLLSSPAEALRSGGFEFHNVCGPDESAYDLARAAIQSGNIDTQSIDAIIYSTCLPANANMDDAGRFKSTRDVKHLMNFPASRLQAEFGMAMAEIGGIFQEVHFFAFIFCTKTPVSCRATQRRRYPDAMRGQSILQLMQCWMRFQNPVTVTAHTAG